MARRSAALALVFALAAALASLTPGVNAADASPWTEIFQLDCGGNVAFMSNHLLAAQGDVKDVVDMAQFISGRAMCLPWLFNSAMYAPAGFAP